MASNVTDNKSNPEHLEHELFLYRNMVNASLDSVTLIDRNYTYRIVNDAYINARQLKKKDILNHTVAEVWGKEIFEQIIKTRLDQCFQGKTVSHVAAYEFQKDEINYIETIYTPCFSSDPEATYAVVISHNITELKKSQDKIKTIAYYDSLTDLPSRQLFISILDHEIKHAKRNRCAVAIFFLDLDEFKKINKSFGHSTGDELLVCVGNRLRNNFRESDTIGRPGGIISAADAHETERFARIGGDEFTLIMPNIPDKKYTTTIAEKMLHIFTEPFQLSDKEIFISPSIGIALFPENGRDVETLLKNADTAMYNAKKMGKNTYQYYSPEMNEQARERIQLENKLRYAIKNDEFMLYYQPQYNISDDRLVGMEALLRWKSNASELISPTVFIPMAEETGMIIPIGEWVIKAACRQGKIWHDQGFTGLCLGVNLSMRQFFDTRLVEKVKSILETTRFDPAFLELEITETSMMQDTDRAIHILNELKKLGIKISLDDFGTGYSSLIYLKNFNTDTVKIDQVFIRNADLKGNDGVIASAIIDMCHKLQVKVVAEGVETQESYTFLKENNCHVAQGFLFCPPLPVAEFQELLEEKRVDMH